MVLYLSIVRVKCCFSLTFGGLFDPRQLLCRAVSCCVVLCCAVVQVWYGALTRSIALSGTAFIKWGQWSSTRPDMFPEGLCRSLSVLHKGAPSHRYAHTKVCNSSSREAIRLIRSTRSISADASMRFLAGIYDALVRYVCVVYTTDNLHNFVRIVLKAEH